MALCWCEGCVKGGTGRDVLFYRRERARMSTEAERLEQLRQKGFVDVDKWKYFDEDGQQQLLALLCNDPQATVLR